MSGVDASSFDVADITVTDVSIDRIEVVGNNLVRYWYSDDGDELAGGTVVVSAVADQVLDLAGNANAAFTSSFIFGVASISGYVYVDVNNDGVKDPQERPLPNVPITLTGHTTATVLTDQLGRYEFRDLPPGKYTLTEQQPSAFYDGIDTPGNAPVDVVENDRFVGIQLGPNDDITGFNFGELGLRLELISKRLFLSFTPSMDAMATVLTVGSNSTWANFQAATSGQLFASVGGAFGHDLVMELYASNMTPILLSSPGGVLNTHLVAGETYTLLVTGEVAAQQDVTLQVIEPDANPQDPRYSFTNLLDPLDVNRDGHISPLDVLLVFNQLNSGGSGPLRGLNLSSIHVDTNSDAQLSPIDALLVINYLNARVAAGEGESDGAGGGDLPVLDGTSATSFRFGTPPRRPKVSSSRLLAPPTLLDASLLKPSFGHQVRQLVTPMKEVSLGASRSATLDAIWDDSLHACASLDAAEVAAELAKARSNNRDGLESLVDDIFAAIDDELDPWQL